MRVAGFAQTKERIGPSFFGDPPHETVQDPQTSRLPRTKTRAHARMHTNTPLEPRLGEWWLANWSFAPRTHTLLMLLRHQSELLRSEILLEPLAGVLIGKEDYRSVWHNAHEVRYHPSVHALDTFLPPNAPATRPNRTNHENRKRYASNFRLKLSIVELINDRIRQSTSNRKSGR